MKPVQVPTPPLVTKHTQCRWICSDTSTSGPGRAWSDATAVCREASSLDASALADRSVSDAVTADWRFPMSVMTTSSWHRPPLSRREMAWLLQSGGDADAIAGAAAEVVDVAATSPADGEL